MRAKLSWMKERQAPLDPARTFGISEHPFGDVDDVGKACLNQLVVEPGRADAARADQRDGRVAFAVYELVQSIDEVVTSHIKRLSAFSITSLFPLVGSANVDQCDFTSFGQFMGLVRGDELPCDLLGDQSVCLLYTSPSPRDRTRSRMPSSA